MIDLMFQRIPPNFYHAAISPHPEDARKWADGNIRLILHRDLTNEVDRQALFNLCIPLRLEVREGVREGAS